MGRLPGAVAAISRTAFFGGLLVQSGKRESWETSVSRRGRISGQLDEGQGARAARRARGIEEARRDADSGAAARVGWGLLQRRAKRRVQIGGGRRDAETKGNRGESRVREEGDPAERFIWRDGERSVCVARGAGEHPVSAQCRWTSEGIRDE